MEIQKKNQIQVNIIFKYNLYIDQSINDKSIISLMNVSYQSENNNTEKVPEESPKNPYLIKEYVPELEIIDKNTIICDKIKYDIKDYIKKINSTSDEFLDDIMIYNHCGKCKNDLNRYFCKNCYKNICDKCYEKCKIEKHDFINLDELKQKSNFCLTVIKKFSFSMKCIEFKMTYIIITISNN